MFLLFYFIVTAVAVSSLVNSCSCNCILYHIVFFGNFIDRYMVHVLAVALEHINIGKKRERKRVTGSKRKQRGTESE